MTAAKKTTIQAHTRRSIIEPDQLQTTRRRPQTVAQCNYESKMHTVLQ